MPRKRFADVDVLKAIGDLVRGGFTGPSQIKSHLEKDPELRHRLPALRTIQKIVKDLTPPDPSGPWSLHDADPEESRIILDVLAVMVERTEGRVWPTRKLADWIVRVQAAAPTLDPWEIYVFASQYRVRAELEQDPSPLDLILAFKGWESAEAQQRYRATLSATLSLDTVDVTSIPEMLFIKE